MRGLAPVCILGLALLVGGPASRAQAQHAATASPLVHPRIVVTFANTVESAPAPPGSTGQRYGGTTYLVGQSAHAMARRVAAQYGLKEVTSWPIKTLAVHCVVYEIVDGRSVAAVLAALAKDPRVGIAEPLNEFHTLTGPGPPYNDPLYDLQTNLAELRIERAHARTQGAGVRIALIDTGVDTRHPDLRGRIASMRSFVPRPPSPLWYRHGTAMAGLIAAVANNHIGIVGIAPRARLEVFEACWQLTVDQDDAVCNSMTLAKAITAAIEAHVQLVNLSIGGPDDKLLTLVVEEGIKKGVTFVGSAAPAEDGFPARVPGVIIAGSTEHPGWPARLTAPASEVFTLRPEGEYDRESGTSVAAAEVTGAIALLMSAAHGRLSSGQISALLTASASSEPSGTGALVPALDINGALLQMDMEQGRMAQSHGR